jgi:hypothetical protein
MSKSVPGVSAALEPLEPRQLLAFANYAQLIHQDLALANFPQLTGRGTTVAVIDSGVNYDLPELGGGIGEAFKVIGGYDFFNNDPDPMDEFGHGTSVASTIAGSPWSQGGIDYQGIAPEARIVALRVGNNSFPSDAIIKSLQWVIDNRRKFNISVVNMSLGRGNFNEIELDEFSPVLKKLADLGIFVVCASGNSNDGAAPPIHQDGVSSPAADPNTFAVGAIDGDDVIADFAQRGTELDLLAPGVSIVLPGIDGSLEPIDGTSFASPMVAGTAALIKQLDPSALAHDIGSALMTSGAPNLDGDDESFGTSGLRFSRLDIDAALKLAKQRIGKYESLNFGTRFDTALDSQGILHAAWYDEANQRVLYSTRDAAGLWSNAYIVDDAGDVGLNLSISVDALGHVGIAYFDATNTAVKYATIATDPADGFATEFVDSNKHVGLSPSLGYDIQGNAYIAYYRRSGGDLRLATMDRTTGAWTPTTIDGLGGADVGIECSLDVGEAAFHVPDGFTTFNTTVAIAYADSTNGDLRYARRILDDPSDVWTVTTVDDANGVRNINLALHLPTGGTGLQAQIAYQDASTADVKYAFRNIDFFVETVAAPGRLGNYVQLYFDGNNTPLVVYSNDTLKQLFIATRTGTNTWFKRPSVLSFGPHSTALNKRTNSVFYSWLTQDLSAVEELQVI